MTGRRHVNRASFMLLQSLAAIVVLFVANELAGGDEPPAVGTTKGQPSWQPGTTHRFDGLEVQLSKPVVVARSKGHLWFPCLYRTSTGDLLAIASADPDVYTDNLTGLASWSTDGGLSWSPPFRANYGDVFVSQSNGDAICLPYTLFHREGGIANTVVLLARGSRTPVVRSEGLLVTGFAKRGQPNPKNAAAAGFVFNGDAIPLKDGSHLATMYGNYEGEKRSTLLVARSEDGLQWRILSTVAGSDSPLFGEDGPSEASVCRLKDGRIMAVFRLAGYTRYGQTFSSDEGKTWTTPVKMKGPWSVQPSLVTLPSGVILLSGGRPGLFLWVNRAGDGQAWEQVDLRANHNAAQPQDYIHESENITEHTPGHHFRHETSSYTQTVLLDGGQAMIIYDRGPHGGEKIDPVMPETNSLWVVKVRIRAAKL